MRSDASRPSVSEGHPTSRRGLIRRRIVPTFLAVALLAAPALAAAGPAGADDVGSKQAQATQVADKLDALQQKLITLNSEYEAGKGEVAQATQAVQDAQAQADDANAQLARIEAELQTFSVQAYVTGNDDPGVSAMFTSTGDVAPQKKGYLEAASGSRQDLLDRYEATKAKAESDAATLAEAQQQAEARNAQLEKSQQQAEDAVAEQTKIKSGIDGEVATLVAQEQQRRSEAAAAKAQETAAKATPAGTAATTGTATGPTSPSSEPPATAPKPGPTPGPSPAPSPAPAPSPSPSPSPSPGPKGSVGTAVAAAMSKIGSPYVWAAAGPNAFDCSGLVTWAFAQAGISLSHYSGAQYAETRRISVGELQPGDLVFNWAPGAGGDPSHVGIYIGGGMMVHAPSAGNFVRTDSIYWWTGARVAAGRV